MPAPDLIRGREAAKGKDYMTDRQDLADTVLRIELALRRSHLWSSEPPSPAAMASRTPFCADTLSFPEWLQFVFLPRMHEALEGREPLPEDSNISAMAEESLPALGGDARRLLPLLREFDELIND